MKKKRNGYQISRLNNGVQSMPKTLINLESRKMQTFLIIDLFCLFFVY